MVDRQSHLSKTAVPAIQWVVSIASVGVLIWAFLPKASGAVPVAPDGRVIEMASIPTVVGATEATVGVVEFSDFECEFCRAVALNVEPALHASDVNTGRVIWAYQQYPIEQLHRRARRAAEMAICASDQGKFSEVRRTLFEKGVPESDADLLRTVAGVGIDVSRLGACFETAAAGRVSSQIEAGARLRVFSTPTYLVGRVDRARTLHVMAQISGARSVEDFSQILEALLAIEGDS